MVAFHERTDRLWRELVQMWWDLGAALAAASGVTTSTSRPLNKGRLTSASAGVRDVDAVDAAAASTSDAQCIYGRSSVGGATGGVGDLGGPADPFSLDGPG
jgi:hypothetical protein